MTINRLENNMQSLEKQLKDKADEQARRKDQETNRQ